MNVEAEVTGTRTQPIPAVYEPPRVETVLDAASLAREVHYAGTISK